MNVSFYQTSLHVQKFSHTKTCLLQKSTANHFYAQQCTGNELIIPQWAAKFTRTSLTLCRWGAVAGVLGASVALSLIHTAIEKYSASKQTDGQGKRQAALPQPQPGERPSASKVKAALWQTAKKAARK